MANIQFQAGVHSPEKFAREFLTPLFESGVITKYPKADYYAICYGELCAYSAKGKLLAVWTADVPDTKKDVKHSPGPYTGKWDNRPL